MPPASTMKRCSAARTPITLASTLIAMSLTAWVSMPAWNRSPNMYTPARTSVTPSRCRACRTVGELPMDTMSTRCPAVRSRSAAPVIAARSTSAMSAIASTERPA